MFKVGDKIVCIRTAGWGSERWTDGKPFIVKRVDLDCVNGSFHTDFKYVKKVIKPFGIVKFMESLNKRN